MVASRVTRFSEGPPGWAADPSTWEGGTQAAHCTSEPAFCGLSVSELKQQSRTNVMSLEAAGRPGCREAEQGRVTSCETVTVSDSNS